LSNGFWATIKNRNILGVYKPNYRNAAMEIGIECMYDKTRRDSDNAIEPERSTMTTQVCVGLVGLDYSTFTRPPPPTHTPAVLQYWHSWTE